ncbi:ATPase PAAT-like isoform X2 [Ailuropoda melanoleuca]|uniref:ATPase PAAT-like isoform X2 n=1 Tax=Ailuropoda melanoleuca TaxID=9646 RepID=UPI001494C81B|nr:ATPase PAAT-like isoform X2 [Ailuropoda melanoleuca]
MKNPDLVVLKSSPSSPGEKPCFLYLRCDPNGGEEIVSVGILSSARNMEVYLGEEYCGTSRGKNVCSDPENSENEKIILYKKYLKLEPSTHACKIKVKTTSSFCPKIHTKNTEVSSKDTT